MEYFIGLGYFGLFLSAFLAATILPLSSELVLTLLLVNGLNPNLLVAVATVGNVLGSVVNYAIGFWGSLFVVRKLFKSSEQRFEKSKKHFAKYGIWSLLFAWVPIIGDPLTVIAGVLRVNLWIFLLLVTIGKLGRYMVVTYLTLG
ncbi:MAG: YqaA family protein [Pseudomonadota bacterium]